VEILIHKRYHCRNRHACDNDKNKFTWEKE
jgi:hypothetical protein